MDRFKTTFASLPGVRVRSREEMCTEFGLQYDPADKDEDRVGALSSVYQALEVEQQTTGLVHWLVVDELSPATSDSESDWRGLKTGAVNTVLCIKPTSYEGSSTVLPPTSLTILQFSRVYRCTQAILAWVSYVTLEMEKDGDYNTSFPLAQACPGHEVPGQLPETLVLPRCSCYPYCTTPLSCLLEPHWVSVESLLTRLVQEGVQQGDLVLIFDPDSQSQECMAWIQAKLAGHPLLAGLRLRTGAQYRGCEAGVLVWLGGADYYGSLLDNCTRVTSRLVVVTQSDSDDSGNYFTDICNKACTVNLAKIIYK